MKALSITIEKLSKNSQVAPHPPNFVHALFFSAFFRKEGSHILTEETWLIKDLLLVPGKVLMRGRSGCVIWHFTHWSSQSAPAFFCITFPSKSCTRDLITSWMKSSSWWKKFNYDRCYSFSLKGWAPLNYQSKGKYIVSSSFPISVSLTREGEAVTLVVGECYKVSQEMMQTQITCTFSLHSVIL